MRMCVPGFPPRLVPLASGQPPRRRRSCRRLSAPRRRVLFFGMYSMVDSEDSVSADLITLDYV